MTKSKLHLNNIHWVLIQNEAISSCLLHVEVLIKDKFLFYLTDYKLKRWCILGLQHIVYIHSQIKLMDLIRHTMHYYQR